MEILTTGVAILLAAVVLMLLASPEAKDWAAELIERLARFLCRELHARAKAQSAARATWERVYRESRGAGNWTPAASVPANRHAVSSAIGARAWTD